MKRKGIFKKTLAVALASNDFGGQAAAERDRPARRRRNAQTASGTEAAAGTELRKKGKRLPSA
ncbi:MAG: hypothetical protein ACLVLH_17640 [Eisenbergiella massiliensis]